MEITVPLLLIGGFWIVLGLLLNRMDARVHRKIAASIARCDALTRRAMGEEQEQEEPHYQEDFKLYRAIMRREYPKMTDKQIMIRYVQEDFLGEEETGDPTLPESHSDDD